MSDGALRPLDTRRDLDALVGLIEIAFTDELAHKGLDLRREIRFVKRLMPIILLLSKIFSELRHLFDGFVWEENGHIVGMVTAQKMGNERARWLIGTVATHPDYRRRGIAQQLVSRTLEHARDNGAQFCVLDIRADNAPAYNLYRSMGFVHYDSTTKLKLETLPQVQAQPARGYSLRQMKLNEWPAHYDLAKRATPPEVQAFLPVSEMEHRVSFVGRLITPLLLLLQRLRAYSWAVEKDRVLLGRMRLLASHVEKRIHNLTLILDPAHHDHDALGEPLLTLALQILQNHPPGNTVISVRADQADLLNLLKRYGFAEIETTHRLGTKLGEVLRDKYRN